MAFDIRDHLAKLEPAGKPNKYICPACGGNDFSYNENDGSYNCWNDPSDKHRAEIRNAIAPMKRWERPLRPTASYQFPYKNRNGEEVLRVLRQDANGKKVIHQDYPTVPQGSAKRKAQINELRAAILPYRYQEALDASAAKGSPIFIVEGELCCDKLWEIGIPAVTFLGGSGQYRSNGDYSTLFRNRRIVLCPDRDEPGVALMKEVAADNPGAQFLYAEPDSFEWENLPQLGGYDIGDWIDDGADEQLIFASIVSSDRHEGKDGKPSYEEIISTLERMVGLYGEDNVARISYETQEWLNSHGIKMPSHVIDKILSEARNRVHGKEEMEVLDAKRIAMSEDARKWTIAGILPEGSVMLLAAAPGTGKSTLLYNWALHVATGRSWSKRRCKQGKVLIIQCDEPVVDAAEKLQIIGYAEDDLDYDNIGFIERWRFNNIPQLLELVKKDRPQLVMIDSLTSCLSGMDVDLIRSDAGNCIYELRDIANTYGVSFVILHHLNKSGGIRDSSSFEANVSEVVKLYRPDNNPNPDEFFLEWSKSRSGLAGKHILTRDPASYGWCYGGPVNGGNLELDRIVNALDNRPFERFSRSDAARAIGSFDTVSVGRLLELARRQGLITSSWSVSSDGSRRDRMYHSWDYKEVDIANAFEEPAEPNAEPESKTVEEEDDDWF